MSRQPVRPPAIPPSTSTLTGRGDCRRSASSGQGLNARERVRQHEELEVRIVRDLIDDVAHGLPADRLVGENDALVAEPAGDLQLRHRRHGDRPGAVADLAVEQLRAHGGLAVGREDRAAFGQERGHPAVVVVEHVRLQHGNGQGQVFAQQVPALAADVAEAQAGGAAGDALYEVVQQKVGDVVETGQHVAVDASRIRNPCTV